MITRKTMLYGSDVNENTMPTPTAASFAGIPGTAGGRRASIHLTEGILRTHVLFVGGTGSGKTNTYNHLIPQIQAGMTDRDVMLVFDSKRDFAPFQRTSDAVISSHRNCRGARVIWNLFMDIVSDGWDKACIRGNADEIADAIFADAIEGSSQPFFPRAARDIFAAIIAGMAFLGAEDKAYRVKYLNNKALLKYLTILDADRLRAFISPMPELAGVLKYIGDGQSEQALGVFAELQAVVGHIFTQDYAEDGRFSVRGCVKERRGRTLFIEYDPSRGRSLQPIYQLLVDLFLKEALSTNRPQAGRVFVLCDEFRMLPRLHHFEDALNFGRSLGVSVIAGIQSMEQLYEVYGEYGGRNIASAFQTVFCFRTNNEASRAYIQGLFGKNLSVMQYMTPSGRMAEEQHAGNCVEDWDITALHCGEAIVGLPYTEPFRFQIARYR